MDDFKAVFHVYAGYFLRYPSVYQFFYFHALDHAKKQKKSMVESDEYQRQFAHTFEFLLQNGYCGPEQVESLAKTLIYACHGILTLQFAGNDHLKAEDVFEEIDHAIDVLLRKPANR